MHEESVNYKKACSSFMLYPHEEKKSRAATVRFHHNTYQASVWLYAYTKNENNKIWTKIMVFTLVSLAFLIDRLGSRN